MPRIADMLSRLSWRNLLFLGNFGVAKSAVYLLPLALAAFASERLYGGVELALAVSLQVAAILLGAPLSGVTQLYLIQGKRQVADILLFVACVAAFALTMLIALLWAAGASPMTLLVTASGAAVVVQNVGSTWLRMRGERNWIAWIDGASLLIVGTLVLASVTIVGPDDLGLPTLLLTGFTVAFGIGTALALARQRTAGLLARWRAANAVGFPLMIAGLFGIWLGVGGRILVGLTSPGDVAAYALAFRVAGLALGVPQLAYTAVFPRLYASRTREADRLLSLFLGAALAASVLLALAGPWVVDLFDFAAVDARAEATYRALVPITALQTFYWIGFAMLQLRIGRSGAARASIIPVLLVTGVGIGLILLAAEFISADARFVSWLVALHAAAYFAFAWLLLARRGLPHRRVGLVGLGGGIVLGAVAAAGSL